MPEETRSLDTWGIVEVMGHKRFAGHITEQSFGIAALVRVDVPETQQPGGIATKAYSKLVGVSSIYCITPTTEAIARKAAQQIERWNEPIPVDIPEARQIAAISQAEFEEHEATRGASIEHDGDLQYSDDDDVDEVALDEHFAAGEEEARQ